MDYTEHVMADLEQTRANHQPDQSGYCTGIHFDGTPAWPCDAVEWAEVVINIERRAQR